MLRFLSQNEAIALDTELMNDTYAYTNIQLMELAGLACADAMRDAYPHANRLLVLVGPGNNGGDALVAARHLHLYGVAVTLHFPRDTPSSDEHLKRLRLQCDAIGIAHIAVLPPHEQWVNRFDVIVDGLFGFSFKSANGVRAPFDATIAAVNAAAPCAGRIARHSVWLGCR
jgi:NAD(P)H-hydrate epimerase